jgi:hypothetical protein
VRLAHKYNSTAEGVNTQLLIFIPAYIEFEVGSVVNTSRRMAGVIPIVASPPEHSR